MASKRVLAVVTAVLLGVGLALLRERQSDGPDRGQDARAASAPADREAANTAGSSSAATKTGCVTTPWSLLPTGRSPVSAGRSNSW